MRKPTTWLRISYLVGALADGLAAAVMLGQAILALPSPLTGHLPDTPYRYAMLLAGSLMLGWTLLLLWAARQPVERRGVLPLTVVVVLGLAAASVFSLHADFVPARLALPVLGFQLLLVLLFTTSYVASRRGDGARA